ncbi:hypothetical protein M9Y10_031140 [Tritrichomonas musculus]|uniref:Uncharacterized protein n=1 Tax=Tritrichomonas musculus TaxID=1915356 RepID=A0ABR2H2R7_9EUKA
MMIYQDPSIAIQEPDNQPEKKVVKKRGTSAECKKTKSILENFKPEISVAYIGLCQRFGNGITHLECQKLAEVISLKTNIKLDRESRRRFPMLIKWFDDHWDNIVPNLQNVRMTAKTNLAEVAQDCFNF